MGSHGSSPFLLTGRGNLPHPRPSKWRARPTTIDGIRFASQAEADRYCDLKLLERAGQIDGLLCHPKYPLRVNGQLICTYVADFSYLPHGDSVRVVEDVKSEATAKLPTWRIKKKLMKAIYGIDVVEVMS